MLADSAITILQNAGVGLEKLGKKWMILTNVNNAIAPSN